MSPAEEAKEILHVAKNLPPVIMWDVSAFDGKVVMMDGDGNTIAKFGNPVHSGAICALLQGIPTMEAMAAQIAALQTELAAERAKSAAYRDTLECLVAMCDDSPPALRPVLSIARAALETEGGKG